MQNLEKSLAAAEATLGALQEVLAMIRSTEARHAHGWPTLSQTPTGAFLLDLRPEVATAAAEVRACIAEMKEGKAHPTVDPMIAESTIATTRTLLRVAEEEIREENPTVE